MIFIAQEIPECRQEGWATQFGKKISGEKSVSTYSAQESQ